MESNEGQVISMAKKVKHDQEDRLSTLPDNVLHQIFSLLDMKFAVQASIFGLRWRDLWVSLPTLNFDSRIINERKPKAGRKSHFEKFVNVVFIQHDTSDIQKLRLFYNDKYEISPKCICSWIRGSIRRNIQELDIDMPDTVCLFEFPTGLFTCETLKVLKLKFEKGEPHMRKNMKLLNLISLPLLETLHLKSFTFPKDATKIFSGCPLLESLSLTNIEFYKLRNLDICCPKLKHLAIEDCFDANFGDLCTERDCKIEVVAPCLLSLRLKADLINKYFIEIPSSLVTADFDLEVDIDGEAKVIHEYNMKFYVPRLERYLREVCNVRTLTLCPWIVEVLSKPAARIETLDLQFVNLRYMKLQTWLYGDCIRAIIYLLNCSPSLETLSVEVLSREIFVNCSEWFENWVSPPHEYKDTGLPLQCMYHLKSFEFQGFLGHTNGLKFVEILLKNAMVLEKLVFFTSNEYDLMIKHYLGDFKEKLQYIPRASPSMETFFLQSSVRKNFELDLLNFLKISMVGYLNPLT